MSGWNGFGTFVRVYSWVADANASIDISASRMDTDTDNITANGFGNCLTRDGQGSATDNLPMNGYVHTGAGDATAAGNYLVYGQPNATNGILGTDTNDDAPAGAIGEYLETVGSGGGLVNDTNTDVGNISLTAGDWDVWANVLFNVGSGAVMTSALSWVNIASATKPSFPARAFASFAGSLTGISGYQLPTGPMRISLAITTVIFMSALADFTGGSVSVQGVIMARRAR